MGWYSVIVEARLEPGVSRDDALALVAEDIHVEQDGSTGAVLVRRRVERFEAADAVEAATRIQDGFSNHLLARAVPRPEVWEVSVKPFVARRWWE